MSTQGFVNFLREMGHKVRKVGDAWWYNVQPHVYLNFPFHLPVNPHTFSLNKVLGRDGLIARFTCLPQLGRSSYKLICDHTNYDFVSLSPRTRTATRRGLECCIVKPISFRDLQKSGLRLNRETLRRQGRTTPRGFEEYWRKYYTAAERAEGAEAWGAIINGDLAAYLIAFQLGECSNIFIVRSALKYLKCYPNNALLFKYVQYSLQRPVVREVSYGLESVQVGMESLDHFKLKMGFRKVPIGQRVEFAPWVSLCVSNSVSLRIIRCLAAKFKGEMFGKIVGMLDWYQRQPELRFQS